MVYGWSDQVFSHEKRVQIVGRIFRNEPITVINILDFEVIIDRGIFNLRWNLRDILRQFYRSHRDGCECGSTIIIPVQNRISRFEIRCFLEHDGNGDGIRIIFRIPWLVRYSRHFRQCINDGVHNVVFFKSVISVKNRCIAIENGIMRNISHAEQAENRSRGIRKDGICQVVGIDPVQAG